MGHHKELQYKKKEGGLKDSSLAYRSFVKLTPKEIFWEVFSFWMISVDGNKNNCTLFLRVWATALESSPDPPAISACEFAFTAVAMPGNSTWIVPFLLEKNRDGGLAGSAGRVCNSWS